MVTREEYRARRRAYRDAIAACKAWKHPGSDRGLSLARAREDARARVPGLTFDLHWPQSLLFHQQAARRREVLHLLNTLRAYRASGCRDTSYYAGPAVVQRKLRAALVRVDREPAETVSETFVMQRERLRESLENR